MAFLENLGRKISETGQGALQKTKGFTDTLKLTNMINEEKRTIEQNYTHLGEEFFHACGSNPELEEPFASYCSAIRVSQEKIEEYQQQIRAIREVKTCPVCGEEVEKDAAFCPKCGTKLPEEEAPAPEAVQTDEEAAPRICGNCGSLLEPDAKFCPVCGGKAEAPIAGIFAGMDEQKTE